ncbi:hypothetical protein MMC07_003487 [Pseudocyphellaria aurata]|nr:hypothetical protein [Pseudocyphellaria aurata]
MTTNTSPSYPFIPYIQRHAAFPYTAADFRRSDPSSDSSFYDSPRFVTHIDDPAIARLRTYYLYNLPAEGRVLDLCSSWISHFPPALEEAAIGSTARDPERSHGYSSDTTVKGGGLEVVGLGMNAAELSANPILSSFICQDLNAVPMIPKHLAPLDATTCVVSIDYLTQPVVVLASLLSLTKEGGTVNLVVSNRCFPTKAIGRWLRVGEQERLYMVGDFLWWAGWREVEILSLEGDEERASGTGSIMSWFGARTGVKTGDPLWVVRAKKVSGSGATNNEAEPKVI